MSRWNSPPRFDRKPNAGKRTAHHSTGAKSGLVSSILITCWFPGSSLWSRTSHRDTTLPIPVLGGRWSENPEKSSAASQNKRMNARVAGNTILAYEVWLQNTVLSEHRNRLVAMPTSLTYPREAIIVVPPRELLWPAAGRYRLPTDWTRRLPWSTPGICTAN